MVNVKNLFGMAVMATALVSCSSSDDLATDGKGNENKAEAAYASFKINLPTTTGTRGVGDPAGTPDFVQGEAKEYEVKNGTILIFDASTDKFVTSAELGTMNPWTTVNSGGVTTAAIATVKLSNVSVTGHYKALVLLNNDVDEATKTKKVTLPTTADTYAAWSKDVDKVNVDKYKSTDGIFMANAPMHTGTSTEPTTLVDVKNICASREEAQAKTATTVYVERGLAKVTMKNFDANYPIDAGTYKDDNVKIVNWQLDVTNKSTFPIHQTGTQTGTLMTNWDQIWNTDRFYDKDNGTFKRVYWGTDPNYSNNELFEGTTSPAKKALEYCKDNFNMITNAQVVGEAGDANPQYCLENTFNLDNMMQGQTTRVVFKAVYTPKALASATSPSDKTFYKIGNNTAIWTATTLSQHILAVALTAMGITDATEQAKYGVDLSKGTNISGVAGQHIIDKANITYSGTPADSKLTLAIVTEINTKLGLSATTGISTYLNGEAYYIARIKHFNELTHWTAGSAYGSDNAAYLGRYGVLRNNWYELSVKSISGLGYPAIPEVKPNVPDDENDQYINVEVKILDWAKRTQDINL